MSLYACDSASPLNFVITGQIRCGSTVIQSSLNSHSKATCHGELLHPNVEIRSQAHYDYFGEPKREEEEGFLPSPPEYWRPPQEGGEMCPEQYLTERVFDNNLLRERSIGIKLLYSTLGEHQLWEYFNERCLSGDFCVIHLTRNPVACFVSLKQAERSGLWHRRFQDRSLTLSPSPVRVDVEELTSFVRQHAANERKVKTMCDDRLEIEYRELFLNYRAVMRGVLDFLELDPMPFISPGVRRLKNRNIKERVQNWSALKCSVTGEVKEYLDRDDLF